ncbi:hypothetical protein BDF21DRAFT_206394 [Thamnidium elegans]|nr:hypothetical protein BDF21DRAFT_206394 [Thamnidium elegans]
MVHFLSGPPTDDVLDVISTYLPDIEVLIFGSVKKYNVIMDLAPFKSLKRCYFVIQQSSTNSHKSISINFKYPDGKEREYYYNSKRKKFSAAQDKRSTSYSRQPFSFLCNKDVEFTVCFVSIYGILNFNIDKLPDSCYHIPKYSILIIQLY